MELVEGAVADAGGIEPLARRSGVSKHTLGRYRRGEFPSKRRRHQLTGLDRYLVDRNPGDGRPPGPRLVDLIERAAPAIRARQMDSSDAPATAAAGQGFSTNAAAQPEQPAARKKSPLVILIVAVTAVAVLLAVVVTRNDGKGGRPVTSVFSAQVDATGPGEDPSEPVALWDRPATTICSSATPGCDTKAMRAGVVRHGQVVDTLCIARGQVVRNGPPGEPGFYDDDRWVKLDHEGQEAFLSNTWYARSKLARELASCTQH